MDQPLKIARDKVIGKDYLLCDYNRDGDSYRSESKLHYVIWDGALGIKWYDFGMRLWCIIGKLYHL